MKFTLVSLKKKTSSFFTWDKMTFCPNFALVITDNRPSLCREFWLAICQHSNPKPSLTLSFRLIIIKEIWLFTLLKPSISLLWKNNRNLSITQTNLNENMNRFKMFIFVIHPFTSTLVHNLIPGLYMIWNSEVSSKCNALLYLLKSWRDNLKMKIS